MMGCRVKILILLTFVQCIFSLEETTEFSESSTLSIFTTQSSLETDEICTCCPVAPSFVNDNDDKVEQIKKQLNEDLSKLEEEFKGKKEKLQEKIKNLEEESEPLIEKLREVRKVNGDKEEELKLDEKLRKSRTLRKEYKESIDGLKSSSETRYEAKRRYRYIRDSCRTQNRYPEYDDSECKEKLAEKSEIIDRENANISSTMESMKKIHEEIVELENQIKVGEEDLWTTIYENREKIKDDVKKLDEIYDSKYMLQDELYELGYQHEENTRKLNSKARKELLKVLPKATYNWIPWYSETRTPKNIITVDDKYYIARESSYYSSYAYGRYSISRKSAYFIDEESYDDEEYVSYDFDVLVGENLVWCKSNETDTEDYNANLPICRAEHEGNLIPGFLSEYGSCRVGYNYQVYYYYKYDDGFEILKESAC